MRSGIESIPLEIFVAAKIGNLHKRCLITAELVNGSTVLFTNVMFFALCGDQPVG